VGGNSDYSKWSFILSSAYTTIKPGQNKITAKFACANNPSVASHYSVNVTGVGNVTNVATAGTKNGIHQISSVATPLVRPTAAPSNSTAALSNSTAALSNSTAALSNSTAAPSNSTNTNAPNSTRGPVSSNATFSPGANNNNLRLLSVSVHLGKSSLHPGDKQTITTTVTDKNSASAIAGALVSERVSYSPYGLIKKFEGTTDDKGKSSYSWTVSNQYTGGTYKVKVEVSALNYEKYSTWKTFKVTPIHHSASNDNFIRSTSENTNGDKHHNHDSTIITSENTNTNSPDHHGNSIMGGGNSIQINPQSQSNINSGSSISSSISNSGISSSISSSSDSNRILDNHKGNGVDNNMNQNINGFAEKIINNVKNNLEMHGIHLP
jgi:hypothetical protein